MKELSRLLKKTPINSFILIITLYNETNPRRIEEYIHCLERNIKHPLIRKIFIFYEEHKIENNQILYDQIASTSLKTEIILIEKRPTFKNIFEFANQKLKGENVIIANSDIYFESSLHKLGTYDFSQKFFVLTRWNRADDDKLYLQTRKNPVYPWVKIRTREIIKNVKWQNSHSADAWIFKSPVPMEFRCDYMIGTYLCDSLINHGLLQAQARGILKVFNPCLSVKACHLDNNYQNKERDFKIALKHFPPEIIEKARAGSIPWCFLKET